MITKFNIFENMGEYKNIDPNLFLNKFILSEDGNVYYIDKVIEIIDAFHDKSNNFIKIKSYYRYDLFNNITEETENTLKFDNGYLEKVFYVSDSFEACRNYLDIWISKEKYNL